jgi:hypothetical protein
MAEKLYLSTMRRNVPFVLYLAALSAVAGWLLSRMSWIGRVGIDIMHKEYKFLKVWYQGAGVIFAVLMILFVIQLAFQNKTRGRTSRLVHVVALLLALGGLYLTYSDFHNDFSHSLLKERFHLGAYLFWIGWISISIFFLTGRSITRSNLQV